MNAESDDDLKRREEAKREAVTDPVLRWKEQQKALAWAEAQLPVRRNTPARCIELERLKLAQLQADSQPPDKCPHD